jgi:hypothetical protein
MAVNFGSSGDRFNFRAASVPKRYATARYATPLVGHLATQDLTALFNDGVIQAVASAIPLYYILSVNSTNGTLSVIRLANTQQMVFQYAGSPALGQQIQANGSTGTITIGQQVRDVVKGVASGGIGTIVGIDEPSVGLLTVEFGS